MKTPKEKAKELVDRMFYTIVDRKNKMSIKMYWDEAKQCALICIDEIIENNVNLLDSIEYHRELNILQEVKQEIEKL